MTFAEMILACEEANVEFDLTMSKCKAFTEASYEQYKINLKEAKLMNIQESGTADDLIFLENEASEGFLARTAKTIERIFKALMDFVKDSIKSVKEFFTGKKTQDTLKKADKVLSENPKLKNKKVTMPDNQPKIKAYEKLESKVDVILARFKAKKFSEKDAAELDKIEEEYNKEKAIKAAIVATIALATIAASTKKCYNMFIKEADSVSEIKVSTDLEATPEDMAAYAHAAQLKASLEKEKLSEMEKAVRNGINTLRSAITGAELVEPTLDVPKDVIKSMTEKYSTESYADMDAELQEAYISDIIESIDDTVYDEYDEMIAAQESTDDTYGSTVDDYLESMVDDLFSGENYYESTEDDDMVTVEEYLDAMESELFGDIEDDDMVTAEAYLDAMESELFGDIEDDDMVTAEAYLDAMEAEIIEEAYNDDLNLLLDEIIDSVE